MPHCIVEASESIQEWVSLTQVTEVVFQAAIESELFNLADIRTRTETFECHKAGSNATHFIHVTVKLMAGREGAEKSFLANTILSALDSMGLTDTALSVEITDLYPDSYVRKFV